MKDPSKKRPKWVYQRAGHWARKSPEERFWLQIGERKNLDKRKCWIWRGATNRHGYGNFLVNGVLTFAHRFAWLLHRGPIPKGLCICHHCDTPRCCNIFHLFLGTNLENIADAVKKGRRRGPLPWQTNTVKLTSDQVREIRRLGKSVSRKVIAERFGITVWHVSDVRYGKVWKQLQQ